MSVLKLDFAASMKGATVEPGWYKVLTGTPKAEPSKDQASINYTIPAKILEGPFVDVELDIRFNSKFLAKMNGFFASIREISIAAFQESLKTAPLIFSSIEELEVAMGGKKLHVKNVHRVVDGKIYNEIDAFLPYDAEVPTTPF